MAEESEDEYDLLTVIMIRQGKEPEENGIFEYLNGIFDGDINRIQKYSHIEWSEPFQIIKYSFFFCFFSQSDYNYC